MVDDLDLSLIGFRIYGTVWNQYKNLQSIPYEKVFTHGYKYITKAEI
jgi:hypothetical protein